MKLSSLNGIYLIRDKSSGKMYIESAYGEDDIYGRCLNYVLSVNEGIKELRGHQDPSRFEFSILEVIPHKSSAEEVIQLENRWKVKMETRDFTLKRNLLAGDG